MKNQNEDKSVKKSSFRKNKAGKKVIGPNDVLSTEMLREYAQAMHKAQKEGKRAPRSAAESIPFKSIEENGIMHLGGREPLAGKIPISTSFHLRQRPLIC